MGCSYTITFSSGHMFDHRGRTQKLWSRGVLPRRWRAGAGVVTRCRWLGRLQPYGDWYKSFCTDMASVSFKEGSEPHWWIVLIQTSANSPCCSVEQRAVLWKSGDLAEDKNWNQFFESNIYQQTELLPAPTLFCLSNPEKPRRDIMESDGKWTYWTKARQQGDWWVCGSMWEGLRVCVTALWQKSSEVDCNHCSCSWFPTKTN